MSNPDLNRLPGNKISDDCTPIVESHMSMIQGQTGEFLRCRLNLMAVEIYEAAYKRAIQEYRDEMLKSHVHFGVMS